MGFFEATGLHWANFSLLGLEGRNPVTKHLKLNWCQKSMGCRMHSKRHRLYFSDMEGCNAGRLGHIPYCIVLHPSTWKPPLQDDESVMDAQATHDQVGSLPPKNQGMLLGRWWTLWWMMKLGGWCSAPIHQPFGRDCHTKMSALDELAWRFGPENG